MATKEIELKRQIYTAEIELHKQILKDKIYGEIPQKPLHLDYKTSYCDENFAAGRATFREIEVIMEIGAKKAILPFTAVIPRSLRPCPAIISIDHEDFVPNKFLPAEEIVQRGYAIFSFCYEHVATNDANFKTGLTRYVAKSRKKKNAPGKLAIIAWAAMRIADFAISLNSVDSENLIISGHGMLGKAALLTAAFDERFKYVIANDSIAFGCGKSAAEMAVSKDYLFCTDYAESNESRNENSEHILLLNSCAPRCILVGSSEDDPRSDPDAEREAIASLGENDFTHFHTRHGTHYLSRDDWKEYLDFIDKKR